MEIAGDRIDPQPDPPHVRHAFASAEAAFDAGNYPLALHLAENKPEIRAAATVMCGAIRPGLALLDSFESPRACLVRAYAHWCLNEADAAGALLDRLADSAFAAAAAELRTCLAAPVDIVLIAMPSSQQSDSFAATVGFRTHTVTLEPDRFGTEMADCLARLPADATPRLILSLGAFGPYLPRRPRESGIPLAFWVGDHDYFYATRYADLARADAILVNSAAEQTELSRHYGARIAAFPGHESYAADSSPAVRGEPDADIRFTGRVFTPYMRDKAQFLFRLATIDDPAIRIDFTEGYLAPDDYAAALARARLVPLYWRYGGGFQTRGIDALLAGAEVYAPEEGICAPLLGDGAAAYHSALREEAGAVLASKRVSASYDELFWPSPAREERFLKFCLFQAALGGRIAEPGPEPGYVPAELRGYATGRGTQVYARIARHNGAAESPDFRHFNHAASAAFYAAILLGDSESVAHKALELFQAGVEAFPDALALRFNRARALWTFGQRAAAVAEFRGIVEDFADLAFDPRHDALLSHRVRVLAEMFPYGDFFRAAVAGKPGAREIIVSGALGYIAADLLEKNGGNPAISVLERAVARCDKNVAAWRILARALAASGKDPREAFYRAVNLYPPELFELLPVGIEAELADGREAEARGILRFWTLARGRVHGPDGQPWPVSDAALDAARRHRWLLSDWTAELFDRIVPPWTSRSS